jgi:hypothetical protein
MPNSTEGEDEMRAAALQQAATKKTTAEDLRSAANRKLVAVLAPKKDELAALDARIAKLSAKLAA